MTNGVFRDDITPPTRSSPNIVKKMSNVVFRDDTTTPTRSLLFETPHFVRYNVKISFYLRPQG